MSDNTINWQINILISDIQRLQELVKNLETELSEVKKRLEKNSEE